MDQDNLQLNIDELGESLELSSETAQKRKRAKTWDIVLWVLIVVLAAAVFVRAFVVSKVAVSGESMTASYYADSQSEHYNPKLTYHSGDKVTVSKLAKPQRGDVVVFYKNDVKSKFFGLFASGNSVEQGGEYYKLIKRVVAVGGDKIWLESVSDVRYKLVIQAYDAPDGEYLYEDYYTKGKQTLSAECFILDNDKLGSLAGHTADNPLLIEQGFFFAIGDNRANSSDSRGELGQVPLSHLFGVVI
ncbi:MAG: signal peptidase I [Clostridiales bacterium]|nr:signal peptidase I [Clostridiales bacterium]